MSKRSDDLRKLIRDVPPPADVKLILDSLYDQSDRAAALVGAALLETALDRLIVHSMKHRDKELERRMFEQNGPLNSFNAKILVATAFGLIAPTMAAELQVVRSVRNVFAHATANLSFETPQIKDEIRRSGVVQILIDDVRFPSLKKPNKFHQNREFGLLVQLLFLLLDSAQSGLSGSRLSILDTNKPPTGGSSNSKT